MGLAGFNKARREAKAKAEAVKTAEVIQATETEIEKVVEKPVRKSRQKAQPTEAE